VHDFLLTVHAHVQASSAQAVDSPLHAAAKSFDVQQVQQLLRQQMVHVDQPDGDRVSWCYHMRLRSMQMPLMSQTAALADMLDTQLLRCSVAFSTTRSFALLHADVHGNPPAERSHLTGTHANPGRDTGPHRSSCQHDDGAAGCRSPSKCQVSA
jgi:hypothetical protein